MIVDAIVARLLEGDTAENHRFGCLMMDLDIPGWDRIVDQIREDDVWEAEGGREDKPHVTLLYGFHEGVSTQAIASRIRSRLPEQVALSGVSHFEAPEYDVVKFDVDCPETHQMHEALRVLPHTLTHAVYQPHATISYVRKGAGSRYDQKLSRPLLARPRGFRFSRADDTSETQTRFRV